MKISMDRFKPPTAADDLQRCAGCRVKMLPEFLDDEGNCQECQKEEQDEDEKD